MTISLRLSLIYYIVSIKKLINSYIVSILALMMDSGEKEGIFEEFLEFVNQKGFVLNKKKIGKERELFREFLNFLSKKKLAVVKKKRKGIPFSVFNKKLSTLESIVCFLREVERLKYKDIAILLRKNPGHIGIIYRKARKKDVSKLNTSSNLVIPFHLFKRNVSVFEQVIVYLKKIGYSFKQVSEILHRDYQTIWTVYQRGKKKL